MRKFAVLVLVFLLFGLLPSFSSAQSPEFVADDCPFVVPSGEAVDCGYLLVPENRSDPNSPTIELAVAIVRSPAPLPDPIIYLEGGPGGSALAAPEAWYDAAFRANRDIILIDQRGTGYSRPTLNCPELDDAEETLPAVQACYDRLVGEGIDLAAYTTVENAADINDLRLALGYDQVNLYGISYGTRLGLEVAENHPEGVRSLIIDAVYPQNVNAYLESAQNTQEVFEAVFDTCAADAACNAAYPDLAGVFYQLIDDLNAQPATYDEGELFGDDLINTLFSELYATGVGARLPAFIYRLADGDVDGAFEILYAADEEGGAEGALTGEELDDYLMESLGYDSIEDMDDYLLNLPDVEYYSIIEGVVYEEYPELAEPFEQALLEYSGLGSYDELYDEINAMSDADYANLIFEAFYGGFGEDDGGAENDGDSEGLFNTIECNDEVPFQTMQQIEAAAQNVVPQIANNDLFAAQEMFDTCAIWQVPTAPANENAPTISAIPTLILNGTFDPITPPKWGAVAAEGLSTHYNYTFPGVGHGAIDGGDCPIGITEQFLANPLQEPDASCIAGMRVNFVIE